MLAPVWVVLAIIRPASSANRAPGTGSFRAKFTKTGGKNRDLFSGFTASLDVVKQYYGLLIITLCGVLLSAGSSSIIEETLAYCSTRENHHVAYFYISFNDGEKQRPENILRSLVSQLLWELSSLPDTLLDLYKRHKHKQPTIEVLLLALRFVMDMPGQTYIFIDALDECPARTGEREELLNALQSVKGYGIPTLHILLTSRREIDINERLTSVLTEPPFGIQNSEVDQDIRIHVRSEVRSNARLSKWPLIIQEEIETELVKGSHGM